MEFLNYSISTGLRSDGRISCKERAFTILIGSNGGFCDLTKGKTRIVLLGFISPSLLNKKSLFSRVCFSFRFFNENLIKKRFSVFQNKNKNFFFLSQLLFPLTNFLKNWCYIEKIREIQNFKKKLEFKIGIIENDGNIQDVINFGISLALKSIEVPLIEFYGQSGILKWHTTELKCSGEKEIFIISNSFSIQENFEGESLFLLDPTYNEEFFTESFMSILIVQQGQIKNIIYGYGMSLNQENFLWIYKLSLKSFSFFIKFIRKILIQKIIKPSNIETIILT